MNHGDDKQSVNFSPNLTVFQLVPEPEQLDAIEKTVASEETILKPQDVERGLDVHNQLLKFRMEYPFTAVNPIANPAKLIKIGNATQAIDIPSGALLMRIKYFGGNMIVSTSGQAALPAATGQDNATDGFIPDPTTLYYVGQKRQLSVYGDAAGVYASFEFYIQG